MFLNELPFWPGLTRTKSSTEQYYLSDERNNFLPPASGSLCFTPCFLSPPHPGTPYPAALCHSLCALQQEGGRTLLQQDSWQRILGGRPHKPLPQSNYMRPISTFPHSDPLQRHLTWDEEGFQAKRESDLNWQPPHTALTYGNLTKACDGVNILLGLSISVLKKGPWNWGARSLSFLHVVPGSL